jgi:hypothetical protein
MEINYQVIGSILLVVIILIIFLVRRNQKDKKELEEKLNHPDVQPKKHPEGEDKI